MKKRHRREAKQIKAFLSDGNVGTQQLTGAILLMALRANVQLSPEIASTLYLAACREIEAYHSKNSSRMPSSFEVDCFLSLCSARLPVLDELERFKRIKIRRPEERRHTMKRRDPKSLPRATVRKVLPFPLKRGTSADYPLKR